MTIAFALGNGRSRLAVNLHHLKTLGPIYGCNALYREFTPDVLISTDRPISEHIQNQGYADQNRMYTRRPLPGKNALRIPQNYYGFSSGPIAVAVACLDGHRHVYLLGFDLGPLPGAKFNNIYADTEFYKKSSARPTFTGNWIKQIKGITRDFPKTSFVRVIGETTATIKDFDGIPNLAHMPMADFLVRINNKKDL